MDDTPWGLKWAGWNACAGPGGITPGINAVAGIGAPGGIPMGCGGAPGIAGW